MSRPAAEPVMTGDAVTRATADRATNHHFSCHMPITGRQPPISRENHMEIHRPGINEAHSDARNPSAYKLIKGGAKWVK